MHELLTIILLALFPAVGNIAGGLAAEWMAASNTLLNRALHVAAGIMLAIVSIEVMPEALKHSPPWLTAFMFMLGGCCYLLVDAGIKYWSQSSGWMVYTAVTADLIGDGLLIGTGAAVSTKLALVLALGQVLADIPEGFAVIVNFRNKGMALAQRLLVTFSFILPVVVAAVGSYYLLKDQSKVTQISSLVLVAGLFCLAAVEDILGEAHETTEDTKLSGICFLGGFSLFVLVSGYFG